MNDENTSKLTRSILAVIFVANMLEQDRALLFPHAVAVFLENYGQHGTIEDAQDLNLDLGNNKIKFSGRWLLHQLIIYTFNHT